MRFINLPQAKELTDAFGPARGYAHLMRPHTFSHAIGFDDAPFDRAHRGNVPVVGAIFSGGRFEGATIGRVRRDGTNSTSELARLVTESRFSGHLQLVMLQGIAVAGFNVVDIATLHELTSLPVIVIARRKPDLDAIRAALLDRVPGGEKKWRLIEAAGPMERAGAVWIQRAGIDAAAAREAVARFAIHSSVPEPLRVAHLIAGALSRGESRGRV